MKVLQVTATLQGTTPPVWRTFHFSPETGLEQVHDMLLIAFNWGDEYPPAFATNDGPITPEEDAYFEANLSDYLATPGDLISYGIDSPDDYHVELELIGTTEESVDVQLPRATDGANQAPTDNGDGNGLAAYNAQQAALADPAHPDHTKAIAAMSEGFDPNAFDLTTINEEARELFDGEGGEDDFAFIPDSNGEVLADDDFSAFHDIDAEADIPFEFEWLEKEHGIKVSDGNVRGVPQEILDFRAGLTDDDVENPRKYGKLLEPLHKKYPDDPMLTLEMAGVYAFTGENGKSRRLIRDMEKQHPDNLELLVNRVNSFEVEEDFLAEVNDLPHPLDIRNHAPGKDGFYHTTEFQGYEEMAIREAVINEDVKEALTRLDRLVNFGFLHGDLEHAVFSVAGMLLFKVDEEVQAGRMEAADDWASAFAPVSDRTQAMLTVGMAEVEEALREMEVQAAAGTTVKRGGPKVGRNDPCPCGSGKKFKKCCR